MTGSSKKRRILTGCIYDRNVPEGAFRVLATRYWPRGVKKERADVWLRGLGPAAELIRRWKSGAITWETFRKEYLAEYKGEEKKEALAELLRTVMGSEHNEIILLCTCREEDRCHRSLLKKILERELASSEK